MIKDLLTTFGLGFWFLGAGVALVVIAIAYAAEVVRDRRGER